MADEACPMPTPAGEDEDAAIRRMLAARRIAIVGLSDNALRPSHGVADYLRGHGYEIVPVNPRYQTVLGLKSYPSLRAVEGPIDVVNVFRRPSECANVARDAVAIGAKGIWLQAGISSEEAHNLATAAKIDFIQNRCLKVEHLMHARRR